jgi:hypothetical protein
MAVDADLDAVFFLSKMDYLDQKPCLLFKENQRNGIDNDILNKSSFVLTRSNKESSYILNALEKKNDSSTEVVLYKKINPTRYIVYLQSKGPFWLVFGDSFDCHWKAYIKEIRDIPNIRPSWLDYSNILSTFKYRGGTQISAKNHYIVNGYANAWHVDSPNPETQAGEALYQVILEHDTQKMVEIGLFIFVFSLAGCMFYFLFFAKIYRR